MAAPGGWVGCQVEEEPESSRYHSRPSSSRVMGPPRLEQLGWGALGDAEGPWGNSSCWKAIL